MADSGKGPDTWPPMLGRRPGSGRYSARGISPARKPQESDAAGDGGDDPVVVEVFERRGRALASVGTAGAPRLTAEYQALVEGGSGAPSIRLARADLPPREELDPRLVLARAPDSERAAGFRVLRQRLVDRGDPRVILVTSPQAREGRTTCAANLAFALAERGSGRVLLVDASRHDPALATLLGARAPVCFADQLHLHRRNLFLPWTFVEVLDPGLHVALVDPERDDEARPFATSVLALALATLRKAYSYIVVDGPPVLSGSDVYVVQDAVDGVLVTVRGGRTTERQLRKAVEQIAAPKVLGAVLMEG